MRYKESGYGQLNYYGLANYHRSRSSPGEYNIYFCLFYDNQ